MKLISSIATLAAAMLALAIPVARAQSSSAIDSTINMTLYQSTSDTGYLMKSTDDLSVYAGAPVNATDEVTLYIHGWVSAPAKPYPLAIRNALLGYTTAKVIMMDWSQTASTLLYPYLVTQFPTICNTMTLMVANLVQARQLDPSKITLVGHSYGAHLCGCLGKYFNNVSTPASLLIGLDPAGPGFNTGNPNCLSYTDAPTTIGVYTSPDLGIDKSICDYNYFINGGGPQPYCVGGSVDCSHVAAMQIFSNEISIGHPNYTYQLCNSDVAARAAGSLMCGPKQPMSMFNVRGYNGITAYNVNAPSN